MLTNNSSAPMILVVEDDSSHLELIQRSFEGTPKEYCLTFANCLQDARKMIEEQLPALILVDNCLPDGDGKELISSAQGQCPVILMTAQGNEQVAVEAMKAGALDYIVKSPSAFSSMSRIVKMALREWKLIQERNRNYEIISRGKMEWEQTFDAVPDLITIIDVDHTISRVNHAMAKRLGLKPKDLPGRKCYEVIHGLTAPPPNCPHVKLLEDGYAHAEEIEEINLGGCFDLTVSPLCDADGQLNACVHVARDITARKQSEEERRKLEQQFQQTQKLESLGILAGGIAHDFNNILTIILGHCYLAKDSAGSVMTRNQHIKQIEIAANRATDLCRQMLAYAGKNALPQTRVSICLQIDEIVKMLKSALKKNVAIETELNRDVPEILADKSQIQQIIMNLIINASEAIGSSKGTIKVSLKTVEIHSSQDETDFAGNVIRSGSYACMEISDNGCGMDEETQKRIFEPFFTTKITGRGLGLSAILGIIKSHFGYMKLSSKPDAGSTFRVYFPLPPAADTVEIAAGPVPVRLAKKDCTILLVDDEEELRKIGSALLTSIGYSVLTASSGREAVEIFQERGSKVDLILMDMIMPEMDGTEAYHIIRKTTPSIPIVICSGFNVDDFSKIIQNDHMTRVILKPYNPDDLRITLTELLEKCHLTFEGGKNL